MNLLHGTASFMQFYQLKMYVIIRMMYGFITGDGDHGFESTSIIHTKSPPCDT